ncbi:flagellin N-terminal helical domain-containing protein [Actinomarinicola tropica]|nr:flagellin [Actinomarinicola tropica]
MRINQNISALNSYRNLSNTNTVMGKSLEKLSSGFRINRAADDAAGLVISQGLRAQVSGLRQATRNAQDGISVVQTAEGALNEVHSMLNRMRDLAVQSVNASNDSDARTAANNEITELKGEIARIADQTKFGSQKLLDGSFGATPASVTGVDADGAYTVAANDDFTLNINGTGAVTVELSALTGANATDTASALQTAIRSALAASGDADIQAFADKVTVTGETVGTGSSLTLEISGLADGETFTLTEGTNNPLAALGLGGAITAADGDAALFQVGANAGETIEVKGIDLAAVATAITGDVTTAANATAFISAMDDAIADVSGFRGQLGAVQNRFESTINNLQVTTENLAASESRIRDTDMALEMVSFTRHQILTQAGTAMLGQANQLPQGVLRLLG